MSVEVTGRLPLGKSLEPGDFEDLTPVAVEHIGWRSDGQVVVTFAGDLSPTVVAAVVRRIESRNAVEEQLRERALAALLSNREYLQSTPTQAQAAAQLDALTRQVNGLIRLLLGVLDDVE